MPELLKHVMLNLFMVFRYFRLALITCGNNIKIWEEIPTHYLLQMLSLKLLPQIKICRTLIYILENHTLLSPMGFNLKERVIIY